MIILGTAACGTEPGSALPASSPGVAKSTLLGQTWRYERIYLERTNTIRFRPLTAVVRFEFQEDCLSVINLDDDQRPLHAWPIVHQQPLPCPVEDVVVGGAALDPGPYECGRWFDRPRFSVDLTQDFAMGSVDEAIDADPRTPVEVTDADIQDGSLRLEATYQLAPAGTSAVLDTPVRIQIVRLPSGR